jgi:DNA uptake protein ComE-like DNA-binding protein
MNRHLVVAILFAAASTGGCMVSQTKYDQAVADSAQLSSDLEKVKTQKSALDGVVKTLKDQNAKLNADVEFITAELQRIKDGRDKERGSVEGRIKELEQKVKDVSAQNRALKAEYEDVKKHNESLKATVTRYQKELKERERSVSAPTMPALPKPPTAAAPAVPGASTAPAAPTPASAMAPAAAGSVNINTASAGDLVLFLGLSKEMADRVVANRPYKIKGELVAKNVLPKPMFDGLKDRITVAQ